MFRYENDPKHKSKIMTYWLKGQVINPIEYMGGHVYNQICYEINKLKSTYYRNSRNLKE